MSKKFIFIFFNWIIESWREEEERGGAVGERQGEPRLGKCFLKTLVNNRKNLNFL